VGLSDLDWVKEKHLLPLYENISTNALSKSEVNEGSNPKAEYQAT